VELFSAFLVRMSGFSAKRLESLRLDRACAALEALERARAERVEVGRALDVALSQERLNGNPAFDDPEERRRLRALLRRTRERAREGGELVLGELEEIGRIFPGCGVASAALASAVERERTADTAYLAAHAADLERAREALGRLFEDPALREAVLLQSREAYRRLGNLRSAPPGEPGATVTTGGRSPIGTGHVGQGASPGPGASAATHERAQRDEGDALPPRDARARQRERVAALYAQRFCAKNDTNSLCGPHAGAFFEDAERGPLALRAEAALANRRSYFSHWAAEALVAAWAARCGAPVRPRVNPLSRREGDQVTFCRMELSQPGGWKRRHGRATLPPEVLQALDAGEPGEALDAAVEAGLALEQRLPVGSFHPLDDAERALAAFPAGPERDAAVADLRELQVQLERFERGGVAERLEASEALDATFERATGGPAARGQAQHYADRWLVHEDCAAQVEVTLGPGARASLAEALEPLVQACALPMERTREAVRSAFAARFGEGRRVPALEALRWFDQESPARAAPASPLGESIAAAIHRVQRLIARAASERGGRIDPDELRRAAAVPGLPERPGFASADLLFARREGAPPLVVVGELHGFLSFPTCLVDVLPERDRVLAEMRASLRRVAGGRRTVEPVLLHLDATARRFPLADAELELIGSTGRPESHRLGELDLSLEGGAIRFLAGGREVVPVATYEGVPFLDYTSSLGPLYDHYQERYFPDALLPAALRDSAPRLTLGDGVVVRRACRRVPVAALREVLDAPSDAARFARARRWAAALGLGDQVFASVSGEPKPLMVDARNPFLVEALLHVLERAPEDGSAGFSEMLPAPQALVLEAPDGPRTSELRMGILRPPAPEGT